MHNPALGQESERVGSTVYKDMAITRYNAKAESGELIFYIKKEGEIVWPGIVKEQSLKELEGKSGAQSNEKQFRVD